VLLLSRADAQARRTVGTATTFHKDPNGVVLASLPSGASVPVDTAQGQWSGVTLDGWVPAASVTAAQREGFDLVVAPRNGQDLRRAPDGAIFARLRYGALLERVGSRGGWVHVRRAGWVVTRSLAADTTGRRQRAAADTAARPADTVAAMVADTTPVTEGRERAAAVRAAPIHATPQGPRLGSLAEGASTRVITRAGDWVRVQVDGWMRADDLTESESDVLVGITAAELRADPERYVGQAVEWRVQYIALRTADEIRPELPAGAPYLLVRGPLPEAGFVYVLIPPDAVERFRAIQPLQTLTIRAVVRAPRTRHLPTPVVELRSFDVEGRER
jgi:hypothetical protein